MSIARCPYNPVIQPKDIKPSRDDFEVIGVFNAGVARFHDRILLLLRVAERPLSKRSDVVLAAFYDAESDSITLKEFEKDDAETDFSDPRLIVTAAGTYLTSISHLRLAESTNGINFRIEPAPSLKPANAYETFGLEDPRITLIGDTYYITYVAVSSMGMTACLASTKDFVNFQRHGVIFCPDNKDVALFPEKIGDKYYALHRPVSPLFNNYQIWLAESADLLCWGNHRILIGQRPNGWEDRKVGAGAVPVKTAHGWLEVYHAADRNNRYCLGAVLLDTEQPWRVLARTAKPILEPDCDYEKKGFFGNTIFTCGLLYDDNKLGIYYGAADTTICYAELPLEYVLASLLP
ncbi:MAG TPA: glycoside hydrolase family 130 protein [Sedimentisphaerales bacterium]|nr:glycoside hydrolase family 130 protein [Sedimentisphaerales bacterium]